MEEIIKAIKRERIYQDNKWGTIVDHPHDVPGWILIMQSELTEAVEAWVHNGGDDEALREILQVVSTGVACLQQHGIFERLRNGKGVKRQPSDSPDKKRVI
ncbi:MAG: hypothetical protein PVI43_01535 [Candidatus Bathyarchaeota archaeon]